jgi:hypothetical protein
MNRPTLLTASRHEAVAGALHRYVELFLQNEEMNHKVDHLSFNCPAELFDKLDNYAPKQLRDMIALVDIGAERETTWSVQDMWSDNGLAARLVLSYPEVYFVFFDMSGVPEKPNLGEPSWDREVAYHHHFVSGQQLIEILLLIQLHGRGFRAIFDPTGVRAHLKRELLLAVDHYSQKIYEPLSQSRIEHAAVTADEEAAFVYLNGYVAYQAGFRVWLLPTEAEYRRIIGAARCLEQTDLPLSRLAGPANFGAVLADWDLAYPDHKGRDTQKSLLEYEDTQIQDGESLIIITGVENEKQDELSGKHNGFRAPKPFGGFFDLLTRDRDTNVLWKRYNDAWNTIIKVDGETWLKSILRRTRDLLSKVWEGRLLFLHFKTDEESTPTINNHSAPYARSAVAERLLARAKVIGTVEPTESVSWIQMALLAGEAKEVLSGMSRTTAYEAIALQNEAEVNAEVSFLGMSAEIDVAARLDKLMQEAKHVQLVGRSTKLKGRKESEVAQLNFLLQTIKNLRLRFTEYEQMDAAEECLRHFSRYQVRLIPWRSRWIFHKSSKWYIDRATKSGTSILRLLAFSLGWILIFSGVYLVIRWAHPVQLEMSPVNSREQVNKTTQLDKPVGSSVDDRKANSFQEMPKESTSSMVEVAISHSLFTFLLQPGIPDVEPLKVQQHFKDSGKGRLWMGGYRLVMYLELAIAYLHLGLLISVVYRRITMRAP